MNKIGSLYQVKRDYWFLFPLKEVAEQAQLDEINSVESSANEEAFIVSKQYNCKITYLSPEDIVVLLENGESLKKILTIKGEVGWIYFDECSNDCFEEVNQ